jgi:cytochrome c6
MTNIFIAGSVLLLFSLSSFMVLQKPDGKTIFEKQCARCHGKDGTKGAFGAKNLQKSILEDNAIMLLIQNGKKAMPPFKKKLVSDEIKSVTEYLKAFRPK